VASVCTQTSITHAPDQRCAPAPAVGLACCREALVNILSDCAMRDSTGRTATSHLSKGGAYFNFCMCC
jgi:hypothetical protein